jgi:ABC-type sugar transport system ATPase subunit
VKLIGSEAADDSRPPLEHMSLQVRNVRKNFDGVPVLRDLSLSVHKGETVALIGSNGSGKSTLVKILTGVYSTETGAEIEVGGRSIMSGDRVMRSGSAGISVVHQDAPLVPSMTVAQAIALQVGFPVRRGILIPRLLRAQAREILDACSVPVGPDSLVAQLSAGERAMVLLALALTVTDKGSKACVILDEATASLSQEDADRFLGLVRRATEHGVGVLMVTHRLDEVHRYCDRVLVLRNGTVAFEGSPDVEPRELVRHMIGTSASERTVVKKRTASSNGASRLVAEDIEGRGLGKVSFAVEPGEILGVVGRSGGGADALLRVVAGVEAATAGHVYLDGTRSVPFRSPHSAIGRGVTYLSPDRATEGGAPSLTIAQNLRLPSASQYWFRARRAAKDVAGAITLLNVQPPNAQATFGSLSGGNQQKVLLGRWLMLHPTLLALDDPTNGVDPETRETIFRVLASLAEEGVAILLHSTEPEQIARVCHRAIVLRDGVISDELVGSRLTEEEISVASIA